ncbi:MAG: hypothetical protein ABSG91_20150 [Syntrophobacteraceae bacterium]|jgi:hypothetical protein
MGSHLLPGNIFEQLVLGEGEPMTCPKCHGGVKKLMSSFSVEVPDEICAKLPQGEKRERCTARRREPTQCPLAA